MHDNSRTLTHPIAGTSTIRRLSLCCATATIAGLFAGGAPSAAFARRPTPGLRRQRRLRFGDQYGVTGPRHRVHQPRQRQASRAGRGARGWRASASPRPDAATEKRDGRREMERVRGVPQRATAGGHRADCQLGAVTVNSTCRSRRHNARVGGAHGRITSPAARSISACAGTCPRRMPTSGAAAASAG